MNADEHAEQLRLVQSSLAISGDKTERHGTYPRRSRIRCPSCGRPLFKSSGRLLCANVNCNANPRHP